MILSGDSQGDRPRGVEREGTLEAGAVGVGGDGLVDLEGKGQGGAAVFAGDEGAGAGADGVEEGLDFEAEGFAGCDGEFREGEAGGGVWAGGRGCWMGCWLDGLI